MFYEKSLDSTFYYAPVSGTGISNLNIFSLLHITEVQPREVKISFKTNKFQLE